jgi:hypothetical protein
MAYWTKIVIKRDRNLEKHHHFSMKKWTEVVQDEIGSEIIFYADITDINLESDEYYNYEINIDEEVSSDRFRKIIEHLFNNSPYIKVDIISGVILKGGTF